MDGVKSFMMYSLVRLPLTLMTISSPVGGCAINLYPLMNPFRQLDWGRFHSARTEVQLRTVTWKAEGGQVGAVTKNCRRRNFKKCTTLAGPEGKSVKIGLKSPDKEGKCPNQGEMS